MVIQVMKEELVLIGQLWDQLVVSEIVELVFYFNNFFWYMKKN